MAKNKKVSKNRENSRARRTRSQLKAALKVGKRFWEKCQEFEAMTIEELDLIKNEKRSATDQHAFSESYSKVRRKLAIN